MPPDAQSLHTPLLTVFVNGGAAGALTCGKMLYQHYSAVKVGRLKAVLACPDHCARVGVLGLFRAL